MAIEIPRKNIPLSKGREMLGNRFLYLSLLFAICTELSKGDIQYVVFSTLFYRELSPFFRIPISTSAPLNIFQYVTLGHHTCKLILTEISNFWWNTDNANTKFQSYTKV